MKKTLLQDWGTFKHTHSISLCEWTELKLHTVERSRCFSRSPCWTARCPAGSSTGPPQSWRPVTRHMGWRNLPAGLPPHIWTWAPGTSVYTKIEMLTGCTRDAEASFSVHVLTLYCGRGTHNIEIRAWQSEYKMKHNYVFIFSLWIQCSLC